MSWVHFWTTSEPHLPTVAICSRTASLLALTSQPLCGMMVSSRGEEGAMDYPKTLGEWRELAESRGWSQAVAWLNEKIAEQGEDQPVLKAPNQVLYLLQRMEER